MQTTHQNAAKLAAAQEALKYVLPGRVLGVGSGSTVNIFIALFKQSSLQNSNQPARGS